MVLQAGHIQEHVQIDTLDTMKVKRPNLFLVGAPKSGTTTLHHWLNRHSDVFMSENKEPRFFCGFPKEAAYLPNRDGFVRNLVTDQADYAALFEPAGTEKWRGESSTDYLWVNEAPGSIFSANRGAESVKIIAVLRNPVERAFSEHSALIRDGLENLGFLDSLDAEGDRYSENWIPLFFHVRRGLYAEALQRYIKIFGKSSVGVFLFDDLVSSPTEFMNDVCDFLQISPVSENLDTQFNRSGVPRSRLIQTIEKSDNFLKSAIQTMTTRRFRTRIKLKVQRLNLKRLQISSLERETAYRLFENDILKTETIIGRDLSTWKL